MNILITAFEPFSGSARNSSLDTLASLPEQIGNCTLVKLTLPVVFDKCAELLREAIHTVAPSAVICLGQAEGRGTITPEYVALNVKHGTSPDNAGQVFSYTPILAGDADAYFSTLPVERIVQNLKDSGIPASVSFTAGTYVCNNLMYHAVHSCKPMEIPAGFIHLPLSYEIAAAENKAGRTLTLPQSVLTEGILSAIGVIYKECL